MLNLVLALEGTRDYSAAEALRRELVDVHTKTDGSDSTNAATALLNLGVNLNSQKKFDQAESVLRKALVIREQKVPEEWVTFNTRTGLGAALAGQKKFAEAEPLLISGYEGMKQREAKIPAANKSNLKTALTRLVQLYTDWGKPEKAAEWQKKLDEFNKANGGR